MTPRKFVDHVAAGLDWLAVEYPSVNPWNSNGSRVLLQHSGGAFGLYDDAGTFLKLLSAPIVHSSEPRWSRTDPDYFYYIHGNELRTFNIVHSGGLSRTVHTFTEYADIYGQGESDLSEDGDHLVLSGDYWDVFTFEISTRTKGPVHRQNERYDGLKIDRQNRIVLSKTYGIYLLDENGLPQLTQANGHAALTGDDMIWSDQQTNFVMKVPLDGSAKTELLRLPWIDAVHISTAPGLDFCIVSTYGKDQLSGRIYKVRLDGSGSEVLAVGINSYVKNDDDLGKPKAVVSRDGTKVLYNSGGDVWVVDLWKPPVLQLRHPPATSVRIDSRASNMANKQFIFEPNGTGDWKLTEITK